MTSAAHHSLGCAILLALVASPVAGQDAVRAHVGHVAEGWRDAPDGMGLLPTALAEARIAVQHAGLAVRNPDDLDGMKTHTRHVLHAVDPTRVAGGPGLGFGVKQAAEGTARHIELAAAADGASAGVKTHAVHIATSARNTMSRADRIVALAARVDAATTATLAAPLVVEINELARALVEGVDADGDGRVGWQEGEGGLDTAVVHAGLLKRGEGMG